MLMARKRLKSQIEAEARYEATHKIIQVNVRWKTAKDIAMFEALRKRFPDMTDSGIMRMAVKELAGRENR